MPNLTPQLATAETPAYRDPGALLSIQLCLQWDDVLAFRDAWNQILDLIPHASVFMTPEWLGSWWHAFNAKKKFYGLVFLDERGRMVGLALFFLEGKSALSFSMEQLRLLGTGSSDSDALDFIVRPGAEAAVAAAFLDWLARERPCDVCTLEAMQPDSVTAQYLIRLLEKRGWCFSKEDSPNFVVDLPATWQEYVEHLAPQFRPLLTRYPRRLESRYRVRLFRCERLPDLCPCLQTLFDLHQKRWTEQGEQGAFSVSERRRFYFDMAEAFLRRGWLEFWLLSLDDEVVAAQFCFRYRQTVSLLQEGFDPRYTADKVGYALRAGVLKEMIRRGATRYDFLGGADSYKLKFGACERQYLDLSFAVPPGIGGFYLAKRHYARKFRGWLRENLPKPLLNVLRNHASRNQRRRPRAGQTGEGTG